MKSYFPLSIAMLTLHALLTLLQPEDLWYPCTYQVGATRPDQFDSWKPHAARCASPAPG